MYSKEIFLKSEKISKKIKKCNYWWHFCLVYLVYLFQFCLVPLFVISVQSSDSSFVHKTGLIFLVGSFYIVSDQYSTDFRLYFLSFKLGKISSLSKDCKKQMQINRGRVLCMYHMKSQIQGIGISYMCILFHSQKKSF